MQPLWRPSEERLADANLTRYIDFVNRKFALQVTKYDQLYQWSINQREDFWASIWEFGDIMASRPYRSVLEDSPTMIGARWFSGARLNFAENLLRYRDDHPALIFKGEGRASVQLTYGELYDQVARLAQSLRNTGVTMGTRVAGFVPNMMQSVIAMLATASIGAIWSSCSPDFGSQGSLDRFGQISPEILFTADGYYYKGQEYDSLERVANIVEHLPSVQKVVVIPYTQARADLSGIPQAIYWDDFLAPESGLPLKFAQLPFDHPLYIMYSSGTTGLPKCLVHGAGGTLIQHLKEQLLHVDLKREDKIFYATTCGWMMWNWLMSALAVGATIMLYDGSPLYPDAGAMFELAQAEGLTIFGTSASYLTAIEKAGLKPKETYDLSSLKTMMSTGSPLAEESFRYVYRDIKEDLCLASISGGTDLISCFALGCPLLPVYAGELQCRGLGMKVESWNETREPLIGEQGELVCTATFPSQPICFWKDDYCSQYRTAYFRVFPHVWHHGDFIEINDRGGVKIYGRSDATLNPSGVRIGTAEIYRIVEALPVVEASIVVGQPWDNDERIILFVKLAARLELTEGLKNRIKQAIRSNATPRHVPSLILAVTDIPVTLNGKKVELAVKNMIMGKPIINRDALLNPEALDQFAELPELRA